MISLFYVTMSFFVLVCAILILLILIQKGRGGGLASAFGGAGRGGQTAFGSKTGDVLTWATSVIFGIFVLLAVTLNLEANHIDTVRHAGTALLTPPTTTPPVMPGNSGSSLPSAPSAPPAITHTPPVSPEAGVQPPATQTIAPLGAGPATPAPVQHVVDRVPVTTVPTTLP